MKRQTAIKLYDSQEAAQLLRAGKPVDVRKDAAIEREKVKDAGDGSLAQIAFIISDQTADRYGDVIAADGWDFSGYKANPVVLWAHDNRAPPVGRGGEPWKTVGNKIKMLVEEWVPREVSEFAWATEQMIRRGFLNAVSVGFRPSEYSYNDDYSINYLKQELLEVSVVPVPANPNALVSAKSAGLWVPQIDEWLTKQLDEKVPGVPFEIAKFAWNVTRAPAVAVPGERVKRPPEGDEPDFPELAELSAATKAHTEAVKANTEAMKSFEATAKEFIEAVKKSGAQPQPHLRAVNPEPPAKPPAAKPLDPVRLAERALELSKKS